ncbi:hypothetical protein Rsub_13132 [Raphidocelis subcapitata]|uniref:GDT1 family protein n=1 Tax=Raphidocelis subcapitata TaxID=307507 RepID=A0A2V0PS47_9CHLO|nr:hypothetical protein Rsub_13132 [Raphidocelis subcapitata]|eukprot:GBG00408.1 hypothetical protein Rsub_13132 [Raphidocelis subcapitata]
MLTTTLPSASAGQRPARPASRGAFASVSGIRTLCRSSRIVGPPVSRRSGLVQAIPGGTAPQLEAPRAAPLAALAPSSSAASGGPAASAGAAAAAGAGAWERGVRLGAALALAGAAGLAAAAAPAAAAEFGAFAEAFAAVKIPGLVGDNQFVEGAVSGFLLIFFSEIGDKTFFIALLLALRQDRTAVFAGTFGALAVMTVISVALGQVFHQLDELLPASSIPFDDLLAVALLLFFGITTLKGAADADARAAEEKDEAGEVVAALGGGGAAALVASTFGLVFAAEWGDKSFLATIALAAASDPAGVVVGAIAGHGLATGIAVAGGGLLSNYVSERTAQYIGGSLFLVFAAATIFDIVTGAHAG